MASSQRLSSKSSSHSSEEMEDIGAKDIKVDSKSQEEQKIEVKAEG